LSYEEKKAQVASATEIRKGLGQLAGRGRTNGVIAL